MTIVNRKSPLRLTNAILGFLSLVICSAVLNGCGEGRKTAADDASNAPAAAVVKPFADGFGDSLADDARYTEAPVE